jgi:hypothetical protein
MQVPTRVIRRAPLRFRVDFPAAGIGIVVSANAAQLRIGANMRIAPHIPQQAGKLVEQGRPAFGMRGQAGHFIFVQQWRAAKSATGVGSL